SEAQFQYYEGQDVGLPGTGTAPIPAAADLTYPAIRRGLVNFKHTYQPGGDLLKESSLNLYYQYIDRRSRLDNFPEAAPLEEINPAADHDTLGATWNNKVTMAGHTVLTGLDVWQRELSSSRIRFLRNGQMLNDTPLPDASFLSTGAFLVDSYKATDRLTLSGGGRVDALHVENDPTEVFSAEEDDDLAWNAHAGASLKLTDTITATAVAARGYRAASLEERYVFLDLGDGRVKLGNPNLDPERSTFFETGIHYVSSGLALSVSGFFNSLDDLIADQIVDEETIINANINQAEIYGTETDVRVLLADLWQLYSSFSYARGRDTLNNEDLPGIAPFNGLAGLRYDEGDGFWGYSELKFSAEQNNPPPGVDSSAEWIRVNMRLGYDFSAWQTEQTVYAGIDNIFDKGYSDYLTTSRGFVFNEPGRSFLVGYRTRF
ncbi:MAG TPA: TonB-dependent receptor, partial [Oligoflexia bacterium]|nr:TonB-dependent receptor [Oligoflexia bacterium]